MPEFELKTEDGRRFQVIAPDMETAERELTEHTGSKPSLLEKAIEPITSIPSTYMGMVGDAKKQMGRGAKQMAEGDILSGSGNLGVGSVDYVTSPLAAPLHTIVGKPIEENTRAAMEGMFGPETAGVVAPIVGGLAEFGASLALPIPKSLPRFGRTAAPAAPPASMLDVTLSEGQASRELPAIQREQAAVRGQSGPPAQRVAQSFMDQQAGQLASARERIASGFDPFAQRIAESPQEAGDVVSQGVQRAAAQTKAGVDAAYRQARGYPGEIQSVIYRLAATDQNRSVVRRRAGENR